MILAKSKTECNIHATRYIQAVFEKRLREEGFSCPNDKLLCWYRVVNGEVLNTLVFQSAWSNLPLMMDITCVITPLFIEPFYISGVHHNVTVLDRRDLHIHRSLADFESCSRPYSIPDIQVYAPTTPGAGIERFDEGLLPLLDQVKTAEACYQMHKAKNLKEGKEQRETGRPEHVGRVLSCNTSRDFLDEVIYMGDESLYPHCLDIIAGEIRGNRRTMIDHGGGTEEDRVCRIAEIEAKMAEIVDSNPSMHALYAEQIQTIRNPSPACGKWAARAAEELACWQQLSSAFSPGGREKYLEVLEQRKQKTIQFLKKKVGLDF